MRSRKGHITIRAVQPPRPANPKTGARKRPEFPHALAVTQERHSDMDPACWRFPSEAEQRSLQLGRTEPRPILDRQEKHNRSSCERETHRLLDRVATPMKVGVMTSLKEIVLMRECQLYMFGCDKGTALGERES